MAAVTVTLSDAAKERFRAALTANQQMETPATDEQLAQYLAVQASAITYDVEIRQQRGNPEGWTF
jgi:hypothetical protein